MKVLPYICQNGVRHKVLGGKGSHNAMWDFAVSPEGRVYFSLCSEVIESSYARLYEYLPREDRFDLLFRVEDVILPADRTIRHSKIHISISFLPNGHLLMSTHTTDKSPEHPYWLPEGYYAHPWEGFSGSHLIEYDPQTRMAHTLGIPVPFETIYGGIYVETTNKFYFTGFLRGHLYSYDLETTAVKDYGQITEYGCFRLHKGPDGKLYWSTRSGYLARLNVLTDEIEQLTVRFTPANNPFSKKIMRLDYAINLPNGKMLLAAVLTNGLFLFDTETDTMVNLGGYGEEQLPEDPDRYRASIYGMAMDAYGVLWYGLTASHTNGATVSSLVRWDVLHGGKPEVLGTLGSPTTRVTASICELHIFNDVLYIADTNHANDMPAVITVDLKQFRPHMYERSEMPDDPFIDSRGAQYQEMDRLMAAYDRFIEDNPFMVRCSKWNAWRLWLKLKPEQSAVKRVILKPDGSIWGLTDGDGAAHFFSVDDQNIEMKPADQMTDDEQIAFQTVPAWPVGQKTEQLGIPGRQYKSVISAAASLADGTWLVGTQAGVVGILRADGSAYRLGRVCSNGPVRAMAASSDGSVVYGVGGDVSDMGLVFRYTKECGIEELGSLRFDADYDPGIHVSCQPCCCDVSKDGKTVAIGVSDRLGTVYRLTF